MLDLMRIYDMACAVTMQCIAKCAKTKIKD